MIQVLGRFVVREMFEESLTEGFHSPSMFRILGSFINSPDFARDFNCPAGSRMNPANRCQVWVEEEKEKEPESGAGEPSGSALLSFLGAVCGILQQFR